LSVLGHVALVLHAHLPWVRHPEHQRPLEERWLHEAIWESYLPLIEVLDRLAHDGVRVGLTLSISPPLAAMLADDLLRARFSDHLGRLERLAAALAEGPSLEPRARAVMPFYQRRLGEVHAVWDRVRGDVVGALRAHQQAGRVELMTSTATHAYLPGLLAAPASIRAQLRLGLRGFAAISGARPRGLWLPECAFDPRLGPDLAAAGVRYTILDAHGLDLARPRPPSGVLAPVLGPSGVAFFARDPDAARDVWSRQIGYPGDPWYREFYRDVGFDLPESALPGELGPGGTRLMTGLKPYRITGPGGDKQPYDPEAALDRAREHARHFVAKREAIAQSAAGHVAAPLLVAPFDAELFGHWWFEGPTFLEHVLRELDASARAGRIGSITLGGYLERFPELPVAEPAPSSWGEGGFGEVWAGPEAARLWRHVHHTEGAVRAAVERCRHVVRDEGHPQTPGGVAGRALDQAIRELLLLEASDWAFMLRRGEMTPYAEARVRTHAGRATRLAGLALAESVAPADAAWVSAVCDRDPFLSVLSGDRIRDAFDAWG
jgi:1,4-alpha-glucan branching enzyme